MPGWGCPPPAGGSRELLRGTASPSSSRFFVLSSPLVRGVQALRGVVGALEYTSPALGRRAAYVGARRGRSGLLPVFGRGLRPAALVGTFAKTKNVYVCAVGVVLEFVRLGVPRGQWECPLGQLAWIGGK